jgi:predicted RNA polymerase sigma factor
MSMLDSAKEDVLSEAHVDWELLGMTFETGGEIAKARACYDKAAMLTNDASKRARLKDWLRILM